MVYCFLISGDSSEANEVKESTALQEQLSPREMDCDQPLVKQAILTEKVSVTQGSNAFLGQI